jgi:two-component system, LytTR family, response regulator
MKLKCAIIDDEPLAREGIARYVSQVDFLELVGTGGNPVELLKVLENSPVDLVFLDIQMPVMNGIDFLKITPNPPMIIITTAYPTYALEGFKLDVMDYLVKPITFSMFLGAVNKAKEYSLLVAKAAQQKEKEIRNDDFFFIKCDYRYEKIFFDDILYVEAMQNYVTIFTTKGKYVTLLNLKTVEQNLDSNNFFRVHKSYIVSVAKIETIENHEVIIQSVRIPVSRQYREVLIERVVTDKLWKK